MENKPKGRPSEGFLNSIKIVFVSLAAGITFMVWSFLSAKMIKANDQTAANDQNNAAVDGQPEGLPTLVSLVLPTAAPFVDSSSLQPTAQTLRSVSVPTQTVSMGPVVQTRVQYVPSSGGGGASTKSGKKSGKRPAATTRTS